MKRMKGKIGMVLAIAIVTMLAIGTLAPQAQAAEFWKQKFTRFSATAGETLVTGDVVCIYSADSRAYKADADDISKRIAVGIIDKGGTAGTSVEVVISGILAGQSAASAGSRLYLSTTAGALTTTANEWGQLLGVVMEGDNSTSRSASESAIYFINVTPLVASGAINLAQ